MYHKVEINSEQYKSDLRRQEPDKDCLFLSMYLMFCGTDDLHNEHGHPDLLPDSLLCISRIIQLPGLPGNLRTSSCIYHSSLHRIWTQGGLSYHSRWRL